MQRQIRIRVVLNRRARRRLALGASVLIAAVAASPAVAGPATASWSCTVGNSTSSGTISSGSTTLIGDCTLSGTVPSGATVLLPTTDVTVASGTVNDGTIDFTADNDEFDTPSGGTFTNAGTVEDTSTTGNIQQLYAGSFLNTGTIENTSTTGTAEMVFAAPAETQDTGTLENASEGTIQAAASTEVDVEQGMTLKLDSGSSTTMANSGPVDSADTGRLLIGPGGGLEVAGGTVGGEMAVNAASISFDSGATAATGDLAVEGAIPLTGSIPAGYSVNFDGANITDTGATTNNGTVTFTDSDSNLTTPSGASFTNAGTLSAAAGARLTVTGSLALTAASTLSVGIAGASDYAEIQVSGAATLGGTLSAQLSGGYVPATGDRQNIIVASPLSGTFSSTQGGNGTGFYTVSYTATTASLVTGAPSITSTTPSTTTATTTKPGVSKLTVSTPKASNDRVTLALTCSSGEGCATQVITATVTREVTVRGRKRSEKVVVATARLKPTAGRRAAVTLTLNAEGRRLLGELHRLSLTLTVSAGGKTSHTYRLTLTAPKPKVRKATPKLRQGGLD